MSSSPKVNTTSSKKPVSVVSVSSVAEPLKKPARKAAPTVVKAAKPIATPAVKSKLKPKPTPSAKRVQAKKPKLVRDSFTLPEADHALIKLCKKAAITQGRETKKSEVVRAAMQVFHALPLNAQLAAYKKLEVLAVGRPKSPKA